MNKPLHCEIDFFKSPHLNQIYYGFELLEKQGLIKLTYKKGIGDASKAVLKVTINNTFTAIYDALDGFNWLDECLDNNLDFFSKIKADFYFKRSFSDKLLTKNEFVKLFPLGFNHFIEHKHIFNDSIKNIVKRTLFPKKFTHKNSAINAFFSNKPIVKNQQHKIIFFTRLWDPEEMALSSQEKAFRNSINDFRIRVIKTCKKEFGAIFLGGLMDNEYGRKMAPDLIAPIEQTSKLKYLENVMNSSICIATTGLHNSTGWKFGEYLACSKAIISQPLAFSVPGDFCAGKNYLEFNNIDELVQNINMLLLNNELMDTMMQRNYHYYNNYLRPDKLVLNSLLEIEKSILN